MSDLFTDAEQPDLVEVEDDWTDLWRGMPSFDHQDLMPDSSLLVHFRNRADRRAFAEFINQQLTAKTKSVWYPKAEIRSAVDKVYTGPKVTPRYPIYVISKGRADSRKTSRCFEWIGVPYHIVIEPHEYDAYAAVIDPAKILVLPFSNLGLGGIPARNWVWEHSISIGAARHWIFDDNISGFCRWQNNLKIEVDNGATICAAEDFVDRYENIAMAAFQYDYFAPNGAGARHAPVVFNSRCYSGILLDNTVTHRWRGRYNEDTDLSLRILNDGLCTVYFNAFLMYKQPTMTMKGGNTDELYAGMNALAAAWEAHAKSCTTCIRCIDGYGGSAAPCNEGRAILEGDGRWRMAEHLREQHPERVTIERKWGRWQHQVDYRAFKPRLGRNVPRLKAGFVLPTGQNEYGLALGKMPEDSGYEAKQATPAPKKTAARQPVAQPQAPPQANLVSALDFIARLGTPAVAEGPASPAEPAKLAPAAPSAQAEKAPALPDTSAPASQDVPDAASQLKAALGLRGHTLLTRDGKFFVSDASRLTDEDRAAIKLHRAALVEMAEPWAEPITITIGTHTGEITSVVPMQVSFGAPQTVSLAEFLGTAPARAESWIPSEPPSLTGIDTIVLNFATTGFDWHKGDRPVGVTVSTLDGQMTRFLPFGFRGENLDEETVRRWMQAEVRGKHIINSKTKFDIHHAREWGVDLEAQGNTFGDIQIDAALHDDERKRFGIDYLAKDYLGGEEVGRVDESMHADYAASDVAEREIYTAQLVGRLKAVFDPLISEQELEAVRALEYATIPVTTEMEKNGSKIDEELLAQMHAECIAEHGRLMTEISSEVGFAFEHNATGWKRLFEKLNLPPSDSYKESVMAEIDHPLVRKGYRAAQYASLDSKIFKAYPAHIHNGILRYSINQLASDEGGTVSGRFSIGIVQQVPNADNHGAVFGNALFPRRLFIPGEGDYLEADAAQIEFRLLVHYSGNARLLQAYKDDPKMSFHKAMQAELKKYKPDMLYTHTKSYNFAAQYGARSIKLAIMMKFITEDEGNEIRKAQRWNDPRLALIKQIEAAYKKAHPEAGALLERAAHLAKPKCDEYCKKGDELHRLYEHRGYVKTLLGRRSRFATAHKTYIGLNRILQGTGADIMKKKLVELHDARKETGFVMRITNHDAVLGDATQPDTMEKVSTILNSQSYPLRVPILWECGFGKSWAETK